MRKPTLLLIHGLVGSLDYFDPAGRIAGAVVHVLDLLGYGVFRDAGQGRLTLRGQAEHVGSWMASATEGPVWLLGHSMGGAVAMLAADQRPELVRGIINVEGNFTMKDAFWSREIVCRSLESWSGEYRKMQLDVRACTAAWGVTPNEQHVEWVKGILDHQPPETVYSMSKAILAETVAPTYSEAVRRVVERDVPLHLIAGARSAKEWDVPAFVRNAARSYAEIAGAGHLMMLEEPAAFCQTVDTILASA